MTMTTEPIIKIELPDHGFCQTAGYLAGHIVLAEGFLPMPGWINTPEADKKLIRREDGRTLSIMEDFDCTDNVAGYAAHYLILTAEEAGNLFNGDNTLDELESLVLNYCGQPDRCETSKQRLQDALHRVQEADRKGLWNQGDWITVRGE